MEISGNTKLVAENFGMLSEGRGLSPSPAEARTAALTPQSPPHQRLNFIAPTLISSDT